MSDYGKYRELRKGVVIQRIICFPLELFPSLGIVQLPLTILRQITIDQFPLCQLDSEINFSRTS